MKDQEYTNPQTCPPCSFDPRLGLTHWEDGRVTDIYGNEVPKSMQHLNENERTFITLLMECKP